MDQYPPMHAPTFYAAILALILASGLASAQEDEVLKRFAEDRDGKVFEEPFGEQFALGDEEVIVFVGQENLVREQKAGEIESRLATAFAEKAPQFRSMAWEGDTVYEQQRDLNFGSWEAQLKGVDASVVIVQFGQMEALDGQQRLPEFVAAYSRLLDQFSAKTKRLVLLSPTPFEPSVSPLALDLTQRQDDLKAYARAIRDIASQRSAIWINLITPLEDNDVEEQRLTHNGIHLNSDGLKRVGNEVAKALIPAFEETEREGLRSAIVEKNRLWFDLWRPMNWAFAYGDRTSQLFGQPTGDRPWLKEELALLVNLISGEEERIHALARGESKPLHPDTPPVIEKPQLEDPEAALAAMTPAEGLSVNLFASEADGVINPVQIAWDEEGRLYVACSPTYPHIIPGAKPADYILVCTDTDNDGRADEFTRYAEGLHMVQGLELGGGGLYVCAGTEILHFRDRDRDGKADEMEVVLSGFGTGDAHQLVNSISYGPDGALWFTQGLHIHSAIETPFGVSRLEKSGVWRWEPKTGRLDGYFNGAMAGHNCWGVAFDDFNQPFHKSGDRPHGYYLLPGMMSLPDPEEYHPRGALFEAPIKTTAIDFIGTEHFPEDLQGCAVLGGFMGNTVDLYRVLDNGSGFRSEKLPDLLKSSDEAFRPVDVSIGPDGAVYVCDFHNRLIGHYQTSYRDPGRDHHHGRIWRISVDERPRAKFPKLVNMKVSELLDQLDSPERWIRYQAKRLLFDSPTEKVLADADARLTFWSRDDSRIPSLLELAGVFQAHGAPRPSLLELLIDAEDPRVRAYGMRLAGHWAKDISEADAILLEGAGDENPRVRLESLVASMKLPHLNAYSIFEKVFTQPQDPFIEYALINASRVLRSTWQSLAASDPSAIPDPLMEFLEKSAGSAQPTKAPGQIVYENVCMNCHQPDGNGLPGIYPPLVSNTHVSGETEPLIKMLLHGVHGPMEIQGTLYNNVMPPSGLSDEEIASVLSYIRSHFENDAPALDLQDVEAVRERFVDRVLPWTSDELISADTN